MDIFRRCWLAARAFLSVTLVALLAACVLRIEPVQDPRLITELESLAHETQTLFTATGRQERQPVYESLAARADDIRLRAVARPTPSGALPERIRAASRQSEGRIKKLIGHASAGGEGRDLSNATAAYMSDYLAALERLRRRDLAAPEPGMSASIAWIGRLALEDALRDALLYERDILNRDR